MEIIKSRKLKYEYVKYDDNGHSPAMVIPQSKMLIWM